MSSFKMPKIKIPSMSMPDMSDFSNMSVSDIEAMAKNPEKSITPPPIPGLDKLDAIQNTWLYKKYTEVNNAFTGLEEKVYEKLGINELKQRAIEAIPVDKLKTTATDAIEKAGGKDVVLEKMNLDGVSNSITEIVDTVSSNINDTMDQGFNNIPPEARKQIDMSALKMSPKEFFGSLNGWSSVK